jgi:diacylglycerol kinase family enzyme
VIANVASGSVGEDAPQEVGKIFADFGVDANVCAPETKDLADCLKDCIDRAPDLLVVLAGDGTARAAAELAGPDGPMIAPLPGGTMNMLPHAVYGPRSWQDALTIALAQGEERTIGGGEVEGHRFLVAAILGSPALWAPAREAARFGEITLAMRRAQRAFRRAFSGRLRYILDDGPREKAEALVFMCPIASRAGRGGTGPGGRGPERARRGRRPAARRQRPGPRLARRQVGGHPAVPAGADLVARGRAGDPGRGIRAAEEADRGALRSGRGADPRHPQGRLR